jgi:hypothetical protein
MKLILSYDYEAGHSLAKPGKYDSSTARIVDLTETEYADYLRVQSQAILWEKKLADLWETAPKVGQTPS